MRRRRYTIELPLALGRRVDRAARNQSRRPSDLAAEVFRWYLSSRDIASEVPTPGELRAIRRGEAAIKRGDYVTLDELRREEALARRPRRSRKKVA